MIRPITLLSVLLAFAAGLWLYQAKHAAQIADREIMRLYRQVDQSRDRISILRAEWAMLNMPDRLRDVAGRHLSLEMIHPTQWATASELGRRLPAPGQALPEAAPDAVAPEVPVARAAEPVAPSRRAAAAAERPVVAVSSPTQPAARRGIEAAPLAPPSGVRAAPARVEPRATRPAASPRPAPRPAPAPAVAASAPARPAMPARPVAAPVASSGQSVLGGAGRAALPPPVPVSRRGAQ